MFEKISGIRIKNDFFNETNDFMFFDRGLKNDTLGKNRNIAIVYGQNGSGKSSIAGAFREIKSMSNYSYIECLNNEKRLLENKPIDIVNKDTIEDADIYVFDEEFINRNVRFTVKDNLDAVVMFDVQGNTQDEIDLLNNRIKDYTKNTIDPLLNKKKMYENQENTISPLYHKNKIREVMADGWAKRHKKIHQLKSFPKITPERIETVCESSKEDLTQEELKSSYEELLKTYNSTNQEDTIDDKIEFKHVIDYNLDSEIVNSLKKKIDSDELSGRELKIKKLIENTKDYSQDAKKYFGDAKIDMCPLCFQEVNSSERNSIIKSITEIFNTSEADKHKTELSEIKLEKLNFDTSSYKKIDPELITEIDEKIYEYNKIIEKIQEDVLKKVNNVYSPITSSSFCLKDKYGKIKELIDELEVSREIFNENIKSSKKNKETLDLVNNQIAYKEAKLLFGSYNKQLGEEVQCDVELKKSNIKLEEYKLEHANKQAQASNISLAVEIINMYLGSIFYSKKRISIENISGTYKVKSNEAYVKLRDLSVGEKNAIALCYFFSKILENCEKKDFYKKETLVVLDDPISSYDSSNKIGVFSLLRFVIDKIVNMNENSRILILTHQIDTLFGCQKICNDINTNISYNSFILSNKKIDENSFRKYNDYSNTINKVFAYAKNPKDNIILNESIGNLMRKVLEGFGTFTYKVSIEKISTDEKILSIISEEKIRDYYKRFMYRLVLHGESHFEERIKGYPETAFDELITVDQKILTAKRLLVFILLLNELHLKRHLDDENALDDVEKWRVELFKEVI